MGQDENERREQEIMNDYMWKKCERNSYNAILKVFIRLEKNDAIEKSAILTENTGSSYIFFNCSAL